MISVVLECRRDESDDAVARLYELGTLGICEEDLPEKGRRLRAYFESAEGLQLPGEWNARVEAVEDHDWVAGSREHWQAVTLEGRLWLAPPWDKSPPPAGRIRIEMPPGVAFGTGLHTTTQLTLEAADRLLRRGDTVLDLGAGSGVLSVAAARLGAGRVFGCDIDFEAAVEAGRAIRQAGVAAGLFCGTARSLASGSIDLVLANINAVVIASLAREIARVLRPGGRAALSGFRTRHTARVRSKLETSGLTVRTEHQRDGWVCLEAWRAA